MTGWSASFSAQAYCCQGRVPDQRSSKGFRSLSFWVSMHVGNHHHYEPFLKCLELGARLTAHSIYCPFSFQPLNFYLKKIIIRSFGSPLCLPNLGRLLEKTFFQTFPTTFPAPHMKKAFIFLMCSENLLNKQSLRSQEQKNIYIRKSVSHFILEGNRSQNP